MMKRNRAFRFVLAGLLSLSGAGLALAGDDAPAELELPEPVAKLVDAMSGVQRVEQAEDGTYVVERRMQVPGSRIPRNVELRIAEDGTVVDWGRMPLMTRTVTREELLQTGEIDLAEALSRREPSIQSRGGR